MFLKISRFFLYCAPLSILIVLPGTFFPFIGGKYFVFRILVTLALMAVLAGWAFEGNPMSLKKQFLKVIQSPIGIAFMAFTGIILLASAFAFDPAVAFWSNYERGEGGFQMIHYLLFFVLLAGVFTKKKYWTTFFTVSLVAMFGTTLYGILSAVDSQAFIGPYKQFADLGVLERLQSARFQGSLGSPAYTAPYMLFSFFYVGWLWSAAKKKKRALLLAIPALSWVLLFFLFAGTRGAFIGLLIALASVLAYAFVRIKKMRLYILGLAAVGILVFGGLFMYRDTAVVKTLPGSRLLKISLNETTAQQRIRTWKSAWKGFKERPILGWGPENFPIVFDRHFDTWHYNANPEEGTGSETWFDRAHNVLFEYLSTAGLLGLISYLSIFTALGWSILLLVKRKRQTYAQEILLVGIAAAYLGQGLLLFDVLPIFINFVAVLALVTSLLIHSHKDHERRT